MFTVFTFIVSFFSLYCSQYEYQPLYQSPMGDVPNIFHWVGTRVTGNGTLHSMWVAVMDNVSAVQSAYNSVLGQDIIYGWTEPACWRNVAQQYSWPFRSIKCVWLHTNTDYWAALCLAIVILTSSYLVLAYAIYRVRNQFVGHTWRSLYIRFLVGLVRQPDIDCSNVRQTFVNTPSVKNKSTVKNHTHAQSAVGRTDSSRQMELVCESLGKKPYMVQQSRSDERRGLDGCRTYYWGKDVGVGYKSFDPKRERVLCYVDVDMYIDMPGLLAAHPSIHLISTFQPTSAAYAGKEYQFNFNKDNLVKYSVSGGAVYTHPVWNYKSDVLISRKRGFLGLFWRVTAYNVDRRQYDPHHQVICLSPIYTYVSPFFALTSFIGGTTLNRLDVVDGNFARFDCVGPSGILRSIARLNCYASATIPAESGDALAAISRMSSVDITVAQVRTTAGVEDAAVAATLAEYYRETSGSPPDMVFPVHASINRYQYGIKDYNAEASNKLHAFMTPIIPGCYSPDDCKGNDDAAVKGRIEDVRADPDLNVTSFMKTCMNEFVELLIPDAQKNKHFPVDLETVYEKQPRPAQQALLKRAEVLVGGVCEEPVNSFQKGEPYQKPGIPRIITTIDEVNKLHYSSFVYSFTECLRATVWYAFAMTPVAIAVRVANICYQALRSVVKTDFSKMDGRVSEILRMLERLAMLRWFHESCHPRIIELMESQQHRKAKTRFGTKYFTAFARLSGSPETADFNSMDNAFVAYMGYRKMGMSPEEAWKKLGLFGGDDGVTADMDPEVHVKVSASVGQLLEIDVVRRGESGVQMLSREYGPNVWHGDPSSMCDIKRQLSKFHTTTTLPPNISAVQKLATKAFSYYLTDPNTPVIGDIGKLITEHYPELIVQSDTDPVMRAKLGTYFAYHPKDVQFPNVNEGDWMYDVLMREIPTFDLRRFRKWIEDVKTGNASLLSPPMCADTLETKVEAQKEAIIVNGEVVPPIMKIAPKSGSVGVCRFYVAGKPGSCRFGESCKFPHGGGVQPPK